LRWLDWRVCASVLLLVAALALLRGCAAPGRAGPYSPMSEADRDEAAAQRLTKEAAKIVGSEPIKAEALLRQALGADLYNGPAHNNLGVLYLKQNPPDLYQAAGEFEWARKLMPGHPDPRLNLAITLERAGRTDEAIQAYRAALEVYPDHLPSLQGLTRAQVRYAKTDDKTAAQLDQIALRGESEAWRDWARAQRLKLRAP
jgi:Tfp pilus assembly protein PilF